MAQSRRRTYFLMIRKDVVESAESLQSICQAVKTLFATPKERRSNLAEIETYMKMILECESKDLSDLTFPEKSKDLGCSD